MKKYIALILALVFTLSLASRGAKPNDGRSDGIFWRGSGFIFKADTRVYAKREEWNR